MAFTDPDVNGLRPISVNDGVVTRPAAAWSPTVHPFLRYLRGQGLTCVPEPLLIEGGVGRLVAIEGDAGAAGWAHQQLNDPCNRCGETCGWPQQCRQFGMTGRRLAAEWVTSNPADRRQRGGNDTFAANSE